MPAEEPEQPLHLSTVMAVKEPEQSLHLSPTPSKLTKPLCQSKILSQDMLRGDSSKRQAMFSAVGRPAFLHVDLDAVSNNVKCLLQCAKNPNIVMVAMVKANAYGHGAVPVALHLKSIGVERLGVGTVEEGFQLRQAGTNGPIHVFGNVQGWEMDECLQHELIATVTTEEAVQAMSNALKRRKGVHTNGNSTRNGYPHPCTVHIQVDTGMSTHGCQPEQLPALVEMCEAEGLHLEGIFTHMADYENKEFTQKQMDTFYAAIKPYRESNLLFHLSNSGSIVSDLGTELDMMRPGIALYGLPPGEGTDSFSALSFKPIASVHGQASLVKCLSPGRQVGYGCTYSCEREEWVVTIPVGYADFYWRHLSNKGVVIRELTGERCPVVGCVSMGAITVKVSPEPEPEVGESFTLVTADFDHQTSVCGITDMTGTIVSELITGYQSRLPRYYTTGSTRSVLSMTHQLQVMQ